MFQFGNQVEFRVDRRHLLFLVMGAILWTFLVFFLGMWTVAESKKRPTERGLRLLGWLDQQRPEDPTIATLSASQSMPSPTALVASASHRSVIQRRPKPPRAAHAPRSVAPSVTEKSKATDDADGTEPSVSAPAPSRRRTPPARRLPQQAAQAQGGAVPPSARKPVDGQAAKREAQKQRKQQEQLRTFPMAPLQRARYTLQLRFSSDFSTLQRIHQRLRKKGYTSATLTREVFRQKRYFRLTIGAFRNPQQAQAYMHLFQQVERTKTTLHKLRKP